MSISRISIVTLVVLGVVAIAGAFAVMPAQALTMSDVDAICLIADCDDDARDALEALVEGDEAAGGECPMLTSPLTVGSTGAAVTDLQMYLVGEGYLVMPTGVAYGYFGSLTQGAVAAWQAANGVSPAAGYWGPISLAAYNASCVPAGDDDDADDADDDDDDFFGGDDEGALEEWDELSQYSGEEVGEDEEDVVVAGIETEADGADQLIERVNVIFDNPSLAAEDDLDDFIQDVSVWLDGEELDRRDVDEASYDRANDEFTFRFTGLYGMIEDGDVGELLVGVTGVRNLDTNAEGEGFDVTIDEVRASSPNGISETYDTDGDLPLTQTFTLETFASASGVELDFGKSDDNPVEGVVIGDDSNDFDADLLGFDMEAEDGDVMVYGLDVDLTSTGSNIDVLINTLNLECGGESYSESIGTLAAMTGTITFEDLDMAIDEGDNVECMLSGEMNEIAGGFSEGDSLTADIDVDATDAEDETGEGLAAADLTGSANGEEQFFYSEGLVVDNFSTEVSLTFEADDLGEDSTGRFVVEFDATAADTDVFLDKSRDGTGAFGTAGEGIVYTLTADGGSTPTVDSATFQCVSNCGTTGDNTVDEFFIEDGDTEGYKLTVTVTADSTPASDDVKVWVDSINWSATDLAAADQFFTSNMGEDSDADTGFLFLKAL